MSFNLILVLARVLYFLAHIRCTFSLTNTTNVQLQQGIHNELSISNPNISELEQLIENLLKTTNDSFLAEEIESIHDNVEVIREELSKSAPKKGFIKTALSGLKAIKGSAEFVAAVAAIAQFVAPMIV